MKRVLVIGATGRTGRQVVSQLLETGACVRALARHPQSASLPPEVEVAAGDLTQPETLDVCFEGIDSVFLVWCAPPATVRSVIEKLAKHARRIVFLSSPYTVEHPFFQASQPNPISLLHEEVERVVKVSGMEWRFLRPGMFAANALWWWAEQIRAGDVVRWPHGLSASAPIDERDIAAVAVHALCRDACAGAEYVLTGPQSMTLIEQVLAIGEALGRSLRYEEIAPAEWSRNVPAPVAKMLLAAWAAGIGIPALVTSTVEEVTGRPPRTFRDWAADHAAAFEITA